MISCGILGPVTIDLAFTRTGMGGITGTGVEGSTWTGVGVVGVGGFAAETFAFDNFEPIQGVGGGATGWEWVGMDEGSALFHAGRWAAKRRGLSGWGKPRTRQAELFLGSRHSTPTAG